MKVLDTAKVSCCRSKYCVNAGPSSQTRKTLVAQSLSRNTATSQTSSWDSPRRLLDLTSPTTVAAIPASKPIQHSLELKLPNEFASLSSLLYPRNPVHVTPRAQISGKYLRHFLVLLF